MHDDKITTLDDALKEIRRLKESADKGAACDMAMYSRLFEENESMVFFFDAGLRLIRFNKACLPLLATEDKDKLINAHITEIFTKDITNGFAKAIQNANETAIKKGIPLSLEETILFRDNHYLSASITVSPVMDNNAQLGTLMIIKDTTELFAIKEQAEEISRNRGTFLANMSHEIRTPMNAIKGLSELLSLTKLNGIQRNYVQNILSSTNSLIGIINDVLDYTRIDANKIIILEGPYNVNELIIEVCNVANMRAEEAGLRFFADISPDIPSVLIGDDVRVRQIMLNLLTNAIKYTMQGFVRFNMYVEELFGVLYLVCEIEDSGIGIQDDDLPHLFEAFSRMNTKANKNILGSGLGLAIAKRLVHAMDGEISVSSNYGSGSTFKFCVPQTQASDLPLCKVNDPEEKKVLIVGEQTQCEAAQKLLTYLKTPYYYLQDEKTMLLGERYTHCLYFSDPDTRPLSEIKPLLPGCKFAILRSIRTAFAPIEENETSLLSPLLITDLAWFLNSGLNSTDTGHHHLEADSSDDFSLKDVSLLVVDDNEINLMVSGEMLRLFGANVVLAGGGKEALALCQRQKFDIIFLDHVMPDMDGLRVTKELRQNCIVNQETPIVALTANVEGDHMLNYYKRAGMDDFIGKPFEFSDLARILLRWLPGEKINTNS